MAIDSRQAILSKVSRAQIQGKIPDAIPNSLPPLRNKLDLHEKKKSILNEWELLGVDVYAEDTEEHVQQCVKSLLAGKKILSWDRLELPYGTGTCLEGEHVYFGDSPYATQALADIGLTGCSAAICGTGSLAITSGKGRPRTASLLPFTHIAIVRSQDILDGMDEYFSRYEGAEALPYLVFITGPSRTADIELSLTLGVHGPGKLIVVLGP